MTHKSAGRKKELIQQTANELRTKEFNRGIDFQLEMARANHLKEIGDFVGYEMAVYSALRHKVFECGYAKKAKFLEEL